MYLWHATGMAPETLPPKQPVEVTVAGKKICLLQAAEQVVAFTALCPHAGAPLCEGWLDAAGKLVCPLHKYRFDPATGRNTTGEGYKLYRYAVQVRGNEIYVGFLE